MTETPHERAPRRCSTDEQVERLLNLAAYGPLVRTKVDDELDALGWTERYDNDRTATDLRAGRSENAYLSDSPGFGPG